MANDSVIMGYDVKGNPVRILAVDTGTVDSAGLPIYRLAMDSTLSVGPVTIGAVQIQSGDSLLQARVAAATALVAANNAMAIHDALIGQVGDAKANGTVIGLLNELVSNSEAANIGVAGHNVVSANASAAPVAVTDAPTAGQRISVTGIIADSDTANLVLRFMEETTGTEIYRFYLNANSPVVIQGEDFALATANKRLMMQTDRAGNIAVTVLWHSVP